MSRTNFLFSLIASTAFLFLPSSSKANEIPGPDQNYKSCAQLQKHLNENNPGDKHEGFERSKLIRRNVDYGKYIVFCNGGTITDGQLGIQCHGNISYSYSFIVATSRYYAGWGKTSGLPNENYNREDYCWWIK